MWQRAAITGFLAGTGVALGLLALVRLTASSNLKVWSRVVAASAFLFPTYVFWIPVERSDRLPTKVLFLVATTCTNGVLYSLVFQAVAGIFAIGHAMLGK